MNKRTDGWGGSSRGPGAVADRDDQGHPQTPRRRDAAVDPHQCGRAPQARRRALRRAAQGHPDGGQRRHRRRARDRVRQHRCRDRAHRWLCAAHVHAQSARLAQHVRQDGPRDGVGAGHLVRALRARRGRSGLADGKADFIAMGRKLLADPDLPNKLQRGPRRRHPPVHLPVPLHRQHLRQRSRCTASATRRPAASTTSRCRRRQIAPHVLVIGGGPGGLEAARVLAGQRAYGHAVGGERTARWHVALRRPRRSSARPLQGLDHPPGRTSRRHARARQASDGRRRRAPSAPTRSSSPPARRGARPSVPGADLAHVRSVPELAAWLDGGDDHLVGQRVVLLGGGKPSVSIADLCIKRGREVAIVEATNVFCGELGLPGRWRLVPDIEAAGARLVDSATVESITADAVQVRIGDSVEIDPGRHRDRHQRRRYPTTRCSTELTAAGVRAHVSWRLQRRAPHRGRQPRCRRGSAGYCVTAWVASLRGDPLFFATPRRQRRCHRHVGSR